MNLKGKRILVISPEPWAGLHMSKHHLSQALAAMGNAVYFLDPPSDTAKAIGVEAQDGLHVVRYKHWLRGVNRMPRAIHMWYYRQLIQRVAARTGGPFDIIWCFDTSRMQWFPDGMGYKLLHLVDYDILFTGHELIRGADIIFTTAQVVKDHIGNMTSAAVHNIGHALDQRWVPGMEQLSERHVAIPTRIVFMGQLANNYNDWEGFHAIAKGHPELDFRFIGPYSLDLPEPAFHLLRALPNVEFTGLKKKDELVPELRNADILLFGFRSGKHAKERANPHKVLEYLSTGNVIVGSWTMEYADKQHLLCMAQEGGDLAAQFDLALTQFDALQTPAARAERIAFAKDRTMNALIARISEQLGA